MVPKWESREYNFTIRTLNEICKKLDLELSVSVDKPCVKTIYKVYKWDKERLPENKKKTNWIRSFVNEGAIA